MPKVGKGREKSGTAFDDQEISAFKIIQLSLQRPRTPGTKTAMLYGQKNLSIPLDSPHNFSPLYGPKSFGECAIQRFEILIGEGVARLCLSPPLFETGKFIPPENER